MKQKFKFIQIRDKPIIDKLLDLILSEKQKNPDTDLIFINRICNKTIRIYFQINDNEKIYFTVWYPSKFYLNQLKKEKEYTNEIKFQ
jgi:hypothetical protein